MKNWKQFTSVARHGCRCNNALAGVFAQQKLQRIKLTWMSILFAIGFIAISLSLTGCDNGTTPSSHTHNWGEWTQTTPPTCTEAGIKTRACTLDPSHIDTQTQVGDPALGHDWQWVETTPATETTAGEETETCSRCGETRNTRPITPHVHEYGEWVVTKPATATEDGQETQTCTICGHEHHRDIPATGNPDCDHVYGEWEIIIPATCTEDGERERHCAKCSKSEIEEITALSHDYQWTQTTAPTLIAAGEETEVCSHNSSHTRNTRPVAQLPVKTAADWTTALSQLSGKTGDYTLTISDEAADQYGGIGVAGSTANTFGATASGSLSVTLKGTGKLYLTSQGRIFTIAANQTLVIDSTDLTLEGLKNGQNGATQDNNQSTVYVNTDGTLELKNGTISGNTKSSSGGGIYVDGGTFTMYGGKITNNDTQGDGAGVYVQNNGTFAMYDGEISGNAANNGGGIYLGGSSTGGNFVMYGGKISGNTATSGGGLYIYNNMCNFTMYGGEISGNTATARGGGAFRGGGNFRIVTGTIYGNAEADETLRNTAVTAGASLYSSGSGSINYGSFSGTGGAWVTTGNFGTNTGTDNTIKVENGVLQ
jgi:hypothetical protein